MGFNARTSKPVNAGAEHPGVVMVTTVVEETRLTSTRNVGAISGDAARSFREEKIGVVKSRRLRRE